ncbi:unnamed protein product [Lactuca virosa]|uniref:Uncharacterized protein n=1 Tax=Lactuca virosa TaxID=75947 RepID=A0AAU9PF46_9ASTR|nr:unnamed protein product [Lactuca virosa]
MLGFGDLGGPKLSAAEEYSLYSRYLAKANSINLSEIVETGDLCKYWDLRQQNPVHTQLPDRCYGLTMRHPLMVVATADRNLVAFNLQNPQTPKITRLLREAGECGAKIVTGVEMFIGQA